MKTHRSFFAGAVFRFPRLLGMLLAMGFFTGVTRSHAQTLLNGSFENPAVPAVGYISGGGDNWTANGSFVFVVSNSYIRGTTNAGNQWLYVRQSGTDAQTISSGFAVGAMYHLSLEAANVFPGSPDYLLVTITGGGAASQAFVIPDRTDAQTGALQQLTYALDFTAFTTGPVTITLQDVDRSNGNGAVAVDNVSLTTASGISLVPEPSTWALLALGGAGLFGLHLRRRRGATS